MRERESEINHGGHYTSSSQQHRVEVKLRLRRRGSEFISFNGSENSPLSNPPRTAATCRQGEENKPRREADAVIQAHYRLPHYQLPLNMKPETKGRSGGMKGAEDGGGN